MNNDLISRFSSAPWLNYDGNIIIFGVGGIGSNLSYILSKIGYSLIVVDYDRVEPYNIGTQFFLPSHIDEFKSEAIKDTLSILVPDSQIISVVNKIEYPDISDIKNNNPHAYFVCFDNIDSRKIIFKQWLFSIEKLLRTKELLIESSFNNEVFLTLDLNLNRYNLNKIKSHNLKVNFFNPYANSVKPTKEIINSIDEKISKFIYIDARMEAESFQVYTISPSFKNFYERVQRYDSTFFEENSLDDLPCTFKSTTHNSLMTASIMTSCFTNAIANIETKTDIREVPFQINFNIPFMMYEKYS